MGYYGYYYDPTYILVIIGIIICAIASFNVSSTFKKYSKVRSMTGMTGREAAERILQLNGIYDVRVEHIAGNLTDHYDPRDKVLRLSDSVYNSQSVAAIGVAAHECGHAVQDQVNYAPLDIRGAMVPAVNFSSKLAWPLIIIGLIFNSNMSYYLIMAGVVLFSLAVLFQIVTLPVEFNASHRALTILRDNSLLEDKELHYVRKVLKAAALTYVASALSAILQLVRLLLIANRRSD
jgi:Zn-dependent membrane protease YugP